MEERYQGISLLEKRGLELSRVNETQIKGEREGHSKRGGKADVSRVEHDLATEQQQEEKVMDCGPEMTLSLAPYSNMEL